MKKILAFVLLTFSFNSISAQLSNVQLLSGAALTMIGTLASTTCLASTGLCIGFSTSKTQSGGVMAGYGKFMAAVYSGLTALSTGTLAAVSLKGASTMLQVPYNSLLKKTTFASAGLLGAGIVSILGKWTYDTLSGT